MSGSDGISTKFDFIPISGFFDLEDNMEILELLENEISILISSQELITNKNLNDYINLIKNVEEHIALDELTILESIFSEDVICSFDDIKEAVKIKEIFPDKYDEFKFEKKVDIDKLIESVVYDEYYNILPLYNKDEIDEFHNELNNIEMEFETDVSEYHRKIDDKLSDIVDNKDNVAKEIKKITPSNSESVDVDEVLINIFNSLMHQQS